MKGVEGGDAKSDGSEPAKELRNLDTRETKSAPDTTEVP